MDRCIIDGLLAAHTFGEPFAHEIEQRTQTCKTILTSLQSSFESFIDALCCMLWIALPAIMTGDGAPAVIVARAHDSRLSAKGEGFRERGGL